MSKHLLFILILAVCTNVFAQQTKSISGVVYGAGFLTFATINATCRIYLRIHKAFLILYKLNALQGTT